MMIDVLLHSDFAYIIHSFQIIKNNERSEDIVTKIDGISSQKIEAKYEITLDEQDKAYIIEIKGAVLTW